MPVCLIDSVSPSVETANNFDNECCFQDTLITNLLAMTESEKRGKANRVHTQGPQTQDAIVRYRPLPKKISLASQGAARPEPGLWLHCIADPHHAHKSCIAVRRQVVRFWTPPTYPKLLATEDQASQREDERFPRRANVFRSVAETLIAPKRLWILGRRNVTESLDPSFPNMRTEEPAAACVSTQTKGSLPKAPSAVALASLLDLGRGMRKPAGRNLFVFSSCRRHGILARRAQCRRDAGDPPDSDNRTRPGP